MNVLTKSFKSQSSGMAAGQGRTLYPLAIAGTGSAVPIKVVHSFDMDHINGKPVGWFAQECGVKKRYQAEHESTIDLAAAACRQALSDAGAAATSIDCLIFFGAVCHQAIPSSAVFIQRELGLATSSIPAFDVNSSCLGFLTALDVAGSLIAAGRYRSVLVCAADLPSKGTTWENPEVKAIFGDGAAAALLTRSDADNVGVLAISLETHSEGAESCQLRAFGTNLDPHLDLDAFMGGARFEMDGRIAYEVASRYMPGFFAKLLEKAGLTIDQIDLVVPHQASAYALKRMRRRLGLPPHKVLDIFADYGNQVAASLPTALHEARSRGLVKTGSTILLLGTGAGITIGGAIVRV